MNEDTVRTARCECGNVTAVCRGELVSVYEDRKHPWVRVPDDIEHLR